jgi:glycosyltransferase involved in cell wall biosynthesis
MGSAKRRLLTVLPANVIGGAERLSKSLVEGLRDSDIAVLTQRGIAPEFAGPAARVFCFDDFGLCAPYDYSLRNAYSYATVLAQVVARERPDAVLAVMHAGSIFLALATLSHPVLFRGIRRVGSIHGHVGAFFRSLGRAPSRQERLAAFLMFSRLDSLVVPSFGVYQDLVAWFPRARTRARVIYNGVDSARIRALGAQPLPIEKHEPWVLMPARLSSQKDHHTLLRAFSTIAGDTGARLVLAGDGEQRAAIETQAAALGVANRLTITGHLPNPFPLIAAAEVVVLSSHYEGFGLVLVEAMALGRPVVATDCPSGPAEIIRDGVDGFLVPPGDAGRLAECLAALLRDGGLRERMGQAGSLRAQYFSQERMFEHYREILFPAPTA